jgi:hypothetical protein
MSHEGLAVAQTCRFRLHAMSSFIPAKTSFAFVLARWIPKSLAMGGVRLTPICLRRA